MGLELEFETKSPDFRTDLGFTNENNWKKHSVVEIISIGLMGCLNL